MSPCHVLAHTLFVHLSNIYLRHFCLLAIRERFAVHFMLLGHLLVTLQQLFLEQFFANVLSTGIELPLINYLLSAVHKIFLLLIVTVVDCTVYRSNDLLVS